MDENSYAGLIERTVPLRNSKVHPFYEVHSDRRIAPSIEIPQDTREDFERVLEKLVVGLAGYSKGRIRFCQDENCRASRRICYSCAFLDIPFLGPEGEMSYFSPGVIVHYDCGHSRIYFVEDPALPRRKRDDLNYDPSKHPRVEDLFRKLIDSRRKNGVAV